MQSTDIEIKPGRETSENAIAQIAQFTGGGLFAAVLTLASMTDIPQGVLITALICAALLGLAPTLHYIASRKAVKCEACRAQAEVNKTIVQKNVAKQAATPAPEAGSTA